MVCILNVKLYSDVPSNLLKPNYVILNLRHYGIVHIFDSECVIGIFTKKISSFKPRGTLL